MKMVKDKKVLVGADFAGVPLKNAVVAHLEKNGWEVTDIGVKSVDEENPEMFHRIGLKVGAKIAEGEFEKALIFCGTGMGFYVAPATGIAMADAFLNHSLGEGYEYWENFYEFHKLAYDELEAFDYEEFKKNGFEVKRLGDVPLPPDPKM